MAHFYFDDQLFIANATKFKERLSNDAKNDFDAYLFVDVSANIECPLLCKKEQLSSIHSSLKRVGLLLLNALKNDANRIGCKNEDSVRLPNKQRAFIRNSKGRKKRQKQSNTKCNGHQKRIIDKDMIEINRRLYPTICGYLLNYLFVYFTDNVQSHCLNRHKLRLFKIGYDGRSIIQFSAPQSIVDAVEEDIMTRYCKRLCSNMNSQVDLSSESLLRCVTL